MPEESKPVHHIRLGAIAASVFRNDGEHGPRYNVSIDRSYRDGDQWKHTRSFGRDDLLLVAKVADMAHTWIHEHKQSSENGPSAAP